MSFLGDTFWYYDMIPDTGVVILKKGSSGMSPLGTRNTDIKLNRPSTELQVHL